MMTSSTLIKIFCKYTIDLGYWAHTPTTLSGKKYVLNKVYVLNKQVSKYVVKAFFLKYSFTCT